MIYYSEIFNSKVYIYSTSTVFLTRKSNICCIRGVCVINIVHTIFVEFKESFFCLFTATIVNDFFMLFVIV